MTSRGEALSRQRFPSFSSALSVMYLECISNVFYSAHLFLYNRSVCSGVVHYPRTKRCETKVRGFVYTLTAESRPSEGTSRFGRLMRADSLTLSVPIGMHWNICSTPFSCVRGFTGGAHTLALAEPASSCLDDVGEWNAGRTECMHLI